MVGAVAVVASQAVIFTSWSDAKAGTLANVVLVVAVIHGFAAQGPASYRTEYHQQVRAAHPRGVPPGQAELPRGRHPRRHTPCSVQTAPVDVLDSAPHGTEFTQAPTVFWVVKWMDLGLVVPLTLITAVGVPSAHHRDDFRP